MIINDNNDHHHNNDHHDNNDGGDSISPSRDILLLEFSNTPVFFVDSNIARIANAVPVNLNCSQLSEM